MYLITGGAGFIGSNIAEKLVSMGQQVRIIDNLTTGKLNNINHLLPQVDFIKGDIRDELLLSKALESVDTIFHLAAMVSVPASIQEPVLCHEINVTASFNLLKNAKKMDVRRVILSSSSAVYGESKIIPKTEEVQFDLRSPYAASKAQMEMIAQMYSNVYGLETVCLRYFNVFGPRQDPDSQYAAVIPKFINVMAKGQSPIVYGDGEQTRDFVYVSDVVEANMLAAKKTDISGKIFNIASGKSVSLNELVKAINLLIGKSLFPTYAPSRSGDIKYSSADISKANQILGFTPQMNLYSGLKQIITDWKLEAAVSKELF